MSRPNWDEYFSKLCEDIALRSVCIRHHFGAIVVNKKHEIISTGYNGPVRGAEHCVDINCDTCRVRYSEDCYYFRHSLAELPGEDCWRSIEGEVACVKNINKISSGFGHQECPAVHAEQNALLQAGKFAEECTLYVNAHPCKICARLMVNAKIKRIVISGEYFDKEGLQILEHGGVTICQLKVL